MNPHLRNTLLFLWFSVLILANIYTYAVLASILLFGSPHVP